MFHLTVSRFDDECNLVQTDESRKAFEKYFIPIFNRPSTIHSSVIKQVKIEYICESCKMNSLSDCTHLTMTAPKWDNDVPLNLRFKCDKYTNENVNVCPHTIQNEQVYVD